MLRLQVIVRNADNNDGKNITDSLFSLYQKSGISGATAWRGIRGYGSRGEVRKSVLDVGPKLPIVIETVGESQKITSILPKVKEIVGEKGLITLEWVQVISSSLDHD